MKEEFSPLYSLKRNTINLFGPIDDRMAELVIAQLQYLEDKEVGEIIMQINSPGGSVSAGLAIYDTMNYIKCPSVTVGVGMAASMGAFSRQAVRDIAVQQRIPKCLSISRSAEQADKPAI